MSLQFVDYRTLVEILRPLLVPWGPDDLEGGDTPSNEDRAEIAFDALERFCAASGQDPEADLEDAMTDLICDLLHLAVRKDLDPAGVVAMAFHHFTAEETLPLPQNDRLGG